MLSRSVKDADRDKATGGTKCIDKIHSGFPRIPSSFRYSSVRQRQVEGKPRFAVFSMLQTIIFMRIDESYDKHFFLPFSYLHVCTILEIKAR